MTVESILLRIVRRHQNLQLAETMRSAPPGGPAGPPRAYARPSRRCQRQPGTRGPSGTPAGHIAARRRRTVHMAPAAMLLRRLKAARPDNTLDAGYLGAGAA
ncbi:MAG: hypothetical protein M3Y33_02540 [Actinomycetota bacterium]|nr:hypothetical protein [Actinomycetota bacterium]